MFGEKGQIKKLEKELCAAREEIALLKKAATDSKARQWENLYAYSGRAQKAWNGGNENGRD